MLQTYEEKVAEFLFLLRYIIPCLSWAIEKGLILLWSFSLVTRWLVSRVFDVGTILGVISLFLSTAKSCDSALLC